MATKIGIIGGSGLYNMGVIENPEEIKIHTPYGPPSDNITLGTISGVQVAFLPRHGKNHSIAPHKINNRANILALKECGVEYLISTAAVGSLKKEIKPGDFLITKQLIDRTAKRKTTFFDDDVVAHIEFADPFCRKLSKIAYETVKKENVAVHQGTYICMEGPQFSTRAESNLYRSWNVDVIGMTLAPEAKLAREAEMCLCSLCAITDYDCWHQEKEDVTINAVLEILKKNNKTMAQIIQNLILKITYKRDCSCASALQHAIVTSPEIVKNSTQEANRILLKKYQ